MSKRTWTKLHRLWRRTRLRVVLLLVCLVLLTSGDDRLTEMERVAARGSLVMLTVNGASTYYVGPEGDTGFEYELARMFSDSIGLPLEVEVVDSVSELLPALIDGRGDFIAGNLSRSPEREPLVRFGPSYEEISQIVVYRQGEPRPASVEELAEGRLAVIAGTSYEPMLAAAANGSELDWDSLDGASIEDIFEGINRQEYDYTIIDSNIFQLNQRFFPALQEAFELGEPQSLAWAVRRGDDDQLVQRMREFFVLIKENGELVELKANYYDHLDRYEPINTFTFMERIQGRLPEFSPMFRLAANNYELDWRLLAAIGYQESHWDPHAVSPTGVRGLMMLTRQTAQHLGIENRRDPAQSIDGGARYIRAMIDRLPERIEQPDRLWLALAAYNIGHGHLEDARRLTEAQDGDPDRWEDVRERLPMLTQERYFRQTRHGYARGYQAVHFVENIRAYFEILVWMDGREHPLIAQAL